MKLNKKYYYILSIVSLFAFQSIVAQHTFSIVAIDPVTGEIGNAGATCLDIDDLNGEEGALVISDIILNTGAIATQSAWDPINQAAARERMLLGESPQQIIDWLVANDPAPGNASSRQYGVVDLVGGAGGTIRSAAFTGANNGSVANDIVGPNYAIQGNILLSQDVLDDMETGFLNTPGTLADKLMGALQGAKRVGAQTSCTNNQTSSKSAFVRVAKLDDLYANYGHLTVDLNVSKTAFGVDPIDTLQETYDFYLANPGTMCASTVNNFPYTEGFENGLGLWEQNDNDLSHVGSPDFDWLENTGGTQTSNTGPGEAFEGSTYLYTEASGANVGFPAKRAVLNSPCLDLTGMTDVFLTFNYHMFGASTGNLAVRVNDGIGWNTIWLLDGAQGNMWNDAVLDLSNYAGQTVQLRLDSTTGLADRSDIAIDNVRIADDILNIDSITLQSLSITPNPATHSFSIFNPINTQINAVLIYDVTGKKVMQINDVTSNGAIDISALPNAIYFVKITTAQGSVVKKLVKE